MKIVSPFHDYYDHAVHASMIDEDVKYIRRSHLKPYDFGTAYEWLPTGNRRSYSEVEQVSTSNWKMSYDPSEIKRDLELQLAMGVLCVGPKAYPIWMRPRNMMHHLAEDKLDVNDIRFPVKHPTFGHGEAQLVDPYGHPDPEQYMHRLMALHGAVKIERTRSFGWRAKDYNAAHENRLKLIAEADTTALCLHYQSPLLIIVPPNIHKSGRGYGRHAGEFYDGMHVLVNPPMSAFSTQSILDAYTLWQEVSMFIGGVTRNTTVTPTPLR